MKGMRKIKRYLPLALGLVFVGLLALLAGSALGAASGPTTLYLPAVARPALITPTPTTVPTVIPASGLWLGGDRKKTLTVQFQVSDDHTQVDYFLMRFTVEGCTGSYEIKVSGAPIENGRFSINALNQTFKADGVFDTNSTASGSVELYHYEIEGCATMTDSAKWSGFHKGPGAPIP